MQYLLVDRDLNLVDTIEMFESMIWTEKYWDIGDFELYLPATKESLSTYSDAAKKHYYIIRIDGNDLSNVSAMEVEMVETDTSVKEYNKLIITGHQIKNILRRRTIINNYNVAGKIQNELRRLVEENAIVTSDSSRSIPNLVLGNELDGLDDIIVNANVKGVNLATAISNICANKKLGWDIKLDFVEGTYKFILLHGEDKTNDVIFSQSFNNLVKTSYYIDSENFRNVAYVDSDYIRIDEKNNTTERVTNTEVVELHGSAEVISGLDRYELYVDGSYEAKETDGISIGYQSSVLNAKGRTELEKYNSKTTVSGEVIPNISFVINKDYYLGDLVKVRNEFNIEYDARVVTVTYTLSSKKDTVIPSFTVENYTGKEITKDTSIKEDEARCTEDGEYRVDEDGYSRKLNFGYEYTNRCSEDGILRCDENQNETITTVKNEYYDDEKYNGG